ncbi:UDP-glucuronate:xylan alpha-glucuronosyltransferase 2 [Acorus gramineus]|uniref:Hexosyltransferase n=1 Tax=Acorus gramineus TaxID=55184 RepID=A0AAV8ZWE7_ACOGR|nr:UDP-glucuronate:xylan alpha-glucuronosyltransferase 2 [Acorus gramineus]
MMRAKSTSKALVIRINLFIVFLIGVYVILLLQPSSFYTTTEKVDEGIVEPKRPSFLNGLQTQHPKIGLVNIDPAEAAGWGGEAVAVNFERVSGDVAWEDLFPEWINEEEEYGREPACPEVPMPELGGYAGGMDVVVAEMPECREARDVGRLQVHLVVGRVVVEKGRRRGDGRVRVAVRSQCRPMVEVFRWEDMAWREGEWWVYEVEVGRLEEKLRLPVGSCRLALPLVGQGIHKELEVTKVLAPRRPQREAYATVLHSSDVYVCGAITLAHSIRATGSRRDLLLLLDYSSIQEPKRRALSEAGWTLVPIQRIRNPRAEKKSYNEYNYSKLRLWQLLDYDKLVFVDADVLVLRNLDPLFSLPQLSATGNDGSIFNSGVMVIEPSNRTFGLLMERTRDVVSYNGGDQGFLNEVFVWWHRLPRRVNFLKNFWANTTEEVMEKERLFGAEPPELYTIHYLGLKPWLCYRDYDCNWNIGNQRAYASDVAHGRWWVLHDTMGPGLRRFCGLTERRRDQLEKDRRKAERLGFADGHWKIYVKDPRRVHVVDNNI